MTAIELVHGMHAFVLLLSSLEEREQVYLKAKGESAAFQKTVTLGYDTMTLTLEAVTMKDGEEETSLYLKCEFDIGRQKVASKQIYCSNKERTPDLQNYIQRHIPEHFPTSTDTGAYSNETLRSVSIADAIAKEVYLLSSGDDYRPGNFSEMIIDNNIITLRQINRHNSRSSAHKGDYFLRDLEFFIPLKPAPPKPSFRDEHIGKMVVRFSDSSSKKNKQGGDKIREKIEEEKLKFGKSE